MAVDQNPSAKMVIVDGLDLIPLAGWVTYTISGDHFYKCHKYHYNVMICRPLFASAILLMFAIWADPGPRDRTQTQNND